MIIQLSTFSKKNFLENLPHLSYSDSFRFYRRNTEVFYSDLDNYWVSYHLQFDTGLSADIYYNLNNSNTNYYGNTVDSCSNFNKFEKRTIKIGIYI